MRLDPTLSQMDLLLEEGEGQVSWGDGYCDTEFPDSSPAHPPGDRTLVELGSNMVLYFCRGPTTTAPRTMVGSQRGIHLHLSNYSVKGGNLLTWTNLS